MTREVLQSKMKSFISILSVLAFLAVCESAPISCPTPEDLAPCTCKRLAYGLHVVCANFDKNSDLIKALKVLRDYEVQKVLLHGLYLTEILPTDLFDGLQISEIRVEKSKLRFSQPAFTGLDESLSILNVAQHSLIKSTEEFSLARLNKLTELNIKSNRLGKVRDQWLNGKIPNVHTIVLDENEISEVESTAFQGLPQLKSISMADNRIKTVSRSMFPRPATALQKIDLSGNEIKTLPYDFFFDMENLREIILSGNDLTTLEEKIWLPVWEVLSVLMIHENNLVCDDNLEWLRTVRWPQRVGGNCVSPNRKSLEEVYKT